VFSELSFLIINKFVDECSMAQRLRDAQGKTAEARAKAGRSEAKPEAAR
jgi:hypothetical protein